MIGWAKPTPVDPRNFKNPVLRRHFDLGRRTHQQFSGGRVAAVVLLVVIKLTSARRAIVRSRGHQAIRDAARRLDPLLVPLCVLRLRIDGRSMSCWRSSI